MKDVIKVMEEEMKAKLLDGNQQVEASKFLVGGDAGSLADAFKRLADVLENQKQAPTQVTKVKIPPTWAKESFSDYKAEVEAWEVAHPGDDYTKYSEFLNELKRNKTRTGLSDYVSTVVVERTRINKTVKNILDELEEKYELTKKEKFEDLINEIKNFKPSKTDSGEKIFGKIENIQVD